VVNGHLLQLVGQKRIEVGKALAEVDFKLNASIGEVSPLL
jgi:hypothetical protein